MSYLAAVDAGGTNTRAITLCIETGELRQARAAGANWTVHGARLCQERIMAAITDALPAGVAPSALAVCVAGYYPPDHAAAAEAWLRDKWPGVPAQVLPDVVSAWAGALGGDPGIVVISGTGSIAYGRNAAGREARAGGWGPLFGDEGSGYAVGVAALRWLSRKVDGLSSAESILEERFLSLWPELGPDLTSWLRGVYRMQWNREQVAGLAREVVDTAEAGDRLAAEIIRSAGRDLSRLIIGVVGKLGNTDLHLALQGGLGGTALLREAVRAAVEEAHLRLTVISSLFGPLEGALLLASELADGADLRHRVREMLAERERETDGHGAH